MLTALIRESECIGCNRCVSACPVDAILGTQKHLHTVLVDECIGCKLCVAPCPVDCIDIIPLELIPATLSLNQDNKQERSKKARQRYKNRQVRLAKQAQRQLPMYINEAERTLVIKKNIQASLSRVRAKKKILIDY